MSAFGSAVVALANDRTPRFNVGGIYDSVIKQYRYVRFVKPTFTTPDGNEKDFLPGQVVYWADTDATDVTNDFRVDGANVIGADIAAGVVVAKVDAGNYGFIQVRGYHPGVYVTTGETAAAGHTLVTSLSDEDGAASDQDGVGYGPRGFGVFLENQVGATVPAFLSFS